jgi:predicted transcriptional regulator
MAEQLAREIKAALALAGVRQSTIARKLGISPNAVWACIHGRTNPPRIRNAIVRAIGRDPWRRPKRRKAS